MTGSSILIATLVVYIIGLLALGILAERRTKNAADFFLGGRRLGPLVAAVGASASSSSAWTLLGVSGAAYAWGLSALWLFPACVGGFLINWFIIAPAVNAAGHRQGAMTLIDLLAGERGARAFKGIAALVVLVSMSAYIASQFQGAGKTFHAVFDVAPAHAVLVGAAIILVYMFLGGFIAVSLTDMVQGLVMAATALLLPIAALVEVGGPTGLIDGLGQVSSAGYLELGGPRPVPLAIGFVAGLLGIGLGYPGQPHVAKYFLAMEANPDTVRRARRLAIAWSVLIYAGMLLVGLCGRVILAELGDRETVFLALAEHLFHPVVAGIMLAAVLSAMMSTADSQLLVVAATFIHDLGLGGRHPLRRTRLVVVLTTAAATVAALVGSQEIFSRVLFGWSAMGAAFGPPLVVGVVFARSMSARLLWVTALVGALLAVFGHALYEPLLGTRDYQGVFRHVVPYVAAFAVAWLGSRRADPHEGQEPDT